MNLIPHHWLKDGRIHVFNWKFASLQHVFDNFSQNESIYVLFSFKQNTQGQTDLKGFKLISDLKLEIGVKYSYKKPRIFRVLQ